MASGGRLEPTAHANGPATTASASVSFSGLLIVTGVSGSGNLDAQFSGFHDTSGGAQPGTVNPLSVTVGTATQSVVLPNGAPSPFTVSAPVNFGVFIPFTVSLSDSAAGFMFHDGSYGSKAADAVLLEPLFSVTDPNGHPIPGAGVEFTPEPASFAWWHA